jgi:hypothetical protein
VVFAVDALAQHLIGPLRVDRVGKPLSLNDTEVERHGCVVTDSESWGTSCEHRVQIDGIVCSASARQRLPSSGAMVLQHGCGAVTLRSGERGNVSSGQPWVGDGKALEELHKHGNAQLENCRYVYVEFYVFPLAEADSFEAFLRDRVGSGCAWYGCWESRPIDEKTVHISDSWKQRRRLLVRFERPINVVEAEWKGCLGCELGVQVVELDSWPFRKGYAGPFVEECVRKIDDGWRADGFTPGGCGIVKCDSADMTTEKRTVYSE